MNAKHPHSELPRPTRIRAVSRAVEVVKLVADHEGRSAAEVADELGIARPTCYHLLNTLVAAGVLSKDPRRRYHLGPTIGALAESFVRQLRLPEHYAVQVDRIAETTGETAVASGWRNGEIVVLASVAASRHAILVAGLHRGFSAGAHARSGGKLLLALASDEVRDAYLRTHELTPLTERTIVDRERLLAELREIRERGYAYDEEEFRDGVACVSAPVFEHGMPLLAFGVSSPVERFRAERERLTKTVLAAAAAVSTGGGDGVA